MHGMGVAFLVPYGFLRAGAHSSSTGATADVIGASLRQGTPPKRQTVREVIPELYNPAQVDVLSRLLDGRVRRVPEASAGPTPASAELISESSAH